ncbi:hypothetical protein G9A89_021496 [Geosiphon pyriformis]|nr:hypothetical protein G9A89_021496 [Geosiphon pyriformis]
MAYAPIVKLKKFTGEKNDTQVWLNNVKKAIIANGWNNARAMQAISYFFQDTTNLWYQSLANKPQDFAAFKLAFLQYFSNNNSINQLANTFTTIKQRENEAVTTYLGHFHRNLHQIQAIQADYFTVLQILNQFIREDASPNTWEPKQKQSLTNILPATVMENESLAAIFPFKIEELTETPLFSRATLKEKPITAMYTDVKIDGQSIKLILDSGSASSIITRQLMDQLGHRVDRAASAKIITADGATKTLIGEIDNLPIEINSITVPIKVLVMEATQYQALVGNDWLFKINATLDWNTQKLQLSQNGQYTRVPAMYNHFKPITMPSALFIEFEEEKEKPTWEAYQISWANKDHNKLPPILSWNNKGKEKKNKELTWNTNQNWETDNNQDEPANWK